MALIQLQDEAPSISAAAAAAVQSLAQPRNSSRILKSSDWNLQVQWWHKKWSKKRTLKNRRKNVEGSLAGSLHCPTAVELQIRCLIDPQSGRGKRLLPNTHRRMRISASPSSPSSSSQRVLTGFKKSGNGWVELEKPSVSSLLSEIKECSRSRDLKRCKKIHSQAIECGLFTNIFLRNSLINVYAKCGSMADAQKVFDASHQVTLVSWNSLIWGYVNNGECEVALEIFERMEEGGYSPDDRSYCAAVTACAALGSREDLKWLSKGKALHSRAIMDDCCDKFVESALVEMYSKLGYMVHARAVFDEGDHQDVVAWNSLLHGYVATSECELVLKLFEAMEESECAPNSRTYLAALAACATLAEEKHGSWLAKGQALHSRAVLDGFCNIFVQSILIHLYATCGNMVHARGVFGNMAERNAVAWNALIKGYVDNRESELALEVFEDMDEEGVVRNSVTYMAALSACAAMNNDEDDKKWVERTKAIQSQAVMDKCCDMSVENSLVNAYGNCGRMVHARAVFDKMATRNVVSWNSLLQGYAENGRRELALELFDILEELEGCWFLNSVTYIAALTACALGRAECLEKGKALHSRAVMNQFWGDNRMKNTLLQMYGKCGGLTHACELFEDMDEAGRNSSWCALLQAYVDNEKWEQAVQIFDTMDVDDDCDFGRTRLAYNLALNACSALASLRNCISWLEKGKAIHSRAAMNHTLDNVVETTLVDFYSASGRMVHAEAVFDQMRSRNVVTWTILLNGYIDNGKSEIALVLFDTTNFEEEEGFVPNSRTYVAALRACTRIADREPFLGLGSSSDSSKWLEKGKSIHSQAAMKRCCRSVCVRNALLSMYGTCGGMVHALAVFDSLWGQADVVSWTALLQGFVENGEAKLALELFEKLEEDEEDEEQPSYPAADPKLFVVAITGCSNLAIKQGHTKWGKWLEKGKTLHSRAVFYGCCNTFVEDALINLYGKCGKMEHAHSLFNTKAEEQQPSIVSWVALIQGYVDNAENATAVELIAEMDLNGVEFNTAAFLAALRACGNLRFFSIGKGLHEDIRACGLEQDPLIATCLVGFYARCRRLHDAEVAFDKVSSKVRGASSWPWDNLMQAYGRKREYKQVLRLFQRMRRQGVRPSEITFNHVLSACSHCGLVRQGYKLFSAMSEEYEIKPDVFHYNCMVDLLARNNLMEEAMKVVRTMPYEPDAVTWTIVLNAAQLRNNLVVGRAAFEALLALKEKDKVAYLLLVQIYEDSGMLEDEQEELAKELRELRPKPANRFARQKMLK